MDERKERFNAEASDIGPGYRQECGGSGLRSRKHPATSTTTKSLLCGVSWFDAGKGSQPCSQD